VVQPVQQGGIYTADIETKRRDAISILCEAKGDAKASLFFCALIAIAENS